MVDRDNPKAEVQRSVVCRGSSLGGGQAAGRKTPSTIGLRLNYSSNARGDSGACTSGAGNAPYPDGSVNVDYLHPHKEDTNLGRDRALIDEGRIKRTDWGVGVVGVK